MSEQSCRDEYDAKLRAFLKSIHPVGRYSIYVIGPKRDQVQGFAKTYDQPRETPNNVMHQDVM